STTAYWQSRQIGTEFVPFSSEWHHLSKQTSNDLSGRLILRLRLTIGVCACLRRLRAFAHPLGHKHLNVAYRLGFRLNWQIARDLMWKRSIGNTMSKSLFGLRITASMLLWTVSSVSAQQLGTAEQARAMLDRAIS